MPNPTAIDQAPTVFIAGAAGMLGNSLMRQIVKNHPDIKIRANYQTTPLNYSHPNIEPVQANLLIQDDCHRAVSGCTYAILAAAKTFGSATTRAKPWLQVNDNIHMNLSLLQACHNAGIKRVIFVSSSTVYQAFNGMIKESELDLNLGPHEAYFGVGWTMRALEKMCEFWHRQGGMEVLVARASYIYGPYARFNPSTSNIIPALIRKASERMNPFEVWGSPDVSRDVIFVDDIARAICRMLFYHQAPFDIFNIGAGMSITVKEIVNAIINAANYSPAIQYQDLKPTTIPFRGLDCSKAGRLLNWQTKTSLSDGIKKTFNWWLNNLNSWDR